MDNGTVHRQQIHETVNAVHEGVNGNSITSDDQVLSETVHDVRSNEIACVSGEDGDLQAKASVLGSDSRGGEKTNVIELNEHSVIDVKCGALGEYGAGEKICRICHLSSDQLSDPNSSLIQIGCRCKGELGSAHTFCAEAWFKLKGNRYCEICGETAKNVVGVGDNHFMIEWNGRRFPGSTSNVSERNRGCWRGQPFCNFLMACLVIAFVLPWFFRINMF